MVNLGKVVLAAVVKALKTEVGIVMEELMIAKS